jgi:DNA primase
LGGTSDVALISFLERNPQINRVTLHLDNDSAGLTAMQKIKAELAADSRFRHIRVSVSPPRGAKDYNDVLLRAVSIKKEQKQTNRHRADNFI